MSHLIASRAPQGLVAEFYCDYLSETEIPVMGFNSDGDALLVAAGRLVTVAEWMDYQCTEGTCENDLAPVPEDEITLARIDYPAKVTVIPAEPGTTARGYHGEVEQVVAWQVRYGSAQPITARSGRYPIDNHYPMLNSEVTPERETEMAARRAEHEERMRELLNSN